jgi:hypothetical protein
VVLSANRSLAAGVPAETLASFDLVGERVLVCAGALFALSYYIVCIVYLRRPSVRALFAETE